MKNIELLAPAGDMEKLKTAFHFGADAVYLAGQKFGLRAFAGNFSDEQIFEAVQYAHNLNKKVYVTINIFAKNSDFSGLLNYLKLLEKAEVDAVLVSDFGIINYVKENCNLPIHISTQANTTNKFAVESYYKLGAERVVLARELSLAEIKEIKQHNPDCELEVFVHGAMCISYSGRCLLSNYMANRDSNHGECVQACRWEWQINEVNRSGEKLTLTEDERGSYILNSKDLNMIRHLNLLIESGVSSLKIEGRMKSPFYVATVVNAYRRAICDIESGAVAVDEVLANELNKASHRKYTTGFFIGDEEDNRQYYETSYAEEESKFIAKVLYWSDGFVTVEQRNKFVDGDTLEILSNNESFNKTVVVKNIVDEKGNDVEICNKVQQILKFPCEYPLSAGDLLRKPSNVTK